MRVVLFLRTMLTYMLVCIAAIVFISPCFLIACLPAKYRIDNRVFFFFLDCFYKTVCFASFARIITTGKENMPHEPAILVANHQSALDIPMVGAVCGGYSYFLFAFAYYLLMSLLSFFIRRMFIPVERDEPAKAARDLIKLYRAVKGRPCHILLFPEGTRRTDGEIHKFFQGFAMLARKTKRPVVPIYMPNNGKIYPPYSFYIYCYPLVTIIGEPFVLKGDETEQEFSDRVKEWFIKQQQAV